MAPRSRKESSNSDLNDELQQISFLDNLDKKAPPEEITPKIVEPKIWTVSELSKDLRENLRSKYNQIVVKGEICDFKGVHRSGHLYMGIKDDTSQIRIVVWKGVVQKIPFDLKMGLEVIVVGTIDYYGAGGSLQIVAEKVEPLGMGALQLKFEQLKEKLQKEGLFSVERKKPIPENASRIGIVTGKSTAALQDMLKIFSQRFPLAEIFVFQASVQGENAPKEIVSAINLAERFSAENKKLDILIVGRGGGSYEDLFCFNDETLVRKIAACSIPTISAVGHEIDFTLADFVADKRAATPTHAASESVSDIRVVKNEILSFLDFFEQSLTDKIKDLLQKTDLLWNQLVSRSPHQRIKIQRQILEQFSLRISKSMQSKIDAHKAELKRYASFLDAISPLKVLERGYSLVQNETASFVRNSDTVKVGENLKITLLKGSLSVSVKEKLS